MNEFLIQLQAILDVAASAENINKTGITELQRKLNELKFQAVIDKNSLSKIAKQIEEITHQKITLSNINLNHESLNKDSRQVGKQIGNELAKSIQSSISENKSRIESVISDLKKNALSGLVSNFNLTHKSIDPSVSKEVNQLTKELNTLSIQAVKAGSDSAWEELISKLGRLRNILSEYGLVKI